MSSNIESPTKNLYRVIYADPPWHFRVRSPKGEGRSAKNHYPVMSLGEIARLDVASIASPDSVLLMWAIDPMLDVALEVIRAWGFDYKTIGFYWVKTNRTRPGFFTGTGYYTRANPEVCLLATRGRGVKRVSKSVPRLVVAPRGHHSEKPDEVRIRINLLYGFDENRRRLEMFARPPLRHGWDSVGLEISGKRIEEELRELKEGTWHLS